MGYKQTKKNNNNNKTTTKNKDKDETITYGEMDRRGYTDEEKMNMKEYLIPFGFMTMKGGLKFFEKLLLEVMEKMESAETDGERLEYGTLINTIGNYKSSIANLGEFYAEKYEFHYPTLYKEQNKNKDWDINDTVKLYDDVVIVGIQRLGNNCDTYDRISYSVYNSIRNHIEVVIKNKWFPVDGIVNQSIPKGSMSQYGFMDKFLG